jgi:hypothetical protein
VCTSVQYTPPLAGPPATCLQIKRPPRQFSGSILLRTTGYPLLPDMVMFQASFTE